MITSAFSKKITLSVWLLVILASGFLFYTNFITSNKINSDLSSILPLEQQEAAELNQVFNQLASKSMIWMLKSKEQSKLLDAVKLAEQQLDSSTQLSIKKNDQESFKKLYQLLLNYPAVFLSEEDRRYLSTNAHKELTQSRVEQLFSPLSSLDSNRLAQDPLQLAENYIKEFSSKMNSKTRYGSYLGYEKDGWHYLLLNVELVGSPFDLNVQESYLAQLASIENLLAPKEIQLLQLGVIGFAASETQQGLFEAQFIGFGSLLVIFVLVTLIFRSFLPLLLISLVIGVSVLIALALSSLIFSDIHILSVLVGASLIGISVDYVFHYFAKNTLYPPSVTVQKIVMPVSLGLITSVLGYLALYFSGLLVLKQIAVISSIGLFSAYVTTLVILPTLKFDLSKRSVSNPIFNTLNGLTNNRLYKRCTLVVALLILAMGVIKLPSVIFDDDLALLHASPQDLKQQQAEIESIVKEAKGGISLVVKADNLQQLLVSIENQNQFFAKQLALENIEAVISPQQFLSSFKQQEKNKVQLLNWVNSNQIGDYLDFIEITDKSALEKAISESENVSIKELGNTPFDNIISQLIIVDEQEKVYGLIKLIGVKDTAPFTTLAQQQANIDMLDTKQSFSQFLQQVRVSSMELVAYAYLAILIILLVIYGMKLGWLVFLPPLSAAIFAIMFASLIGQQLNVFHIVALTLVLGIGIDYTIFYASSGESNKPDMVMAISCSMLSTILAFGLMSFSKTPAVAGFGTVVLVGIIMAYLLSPMAKGRLQ